MLISASLKQEQGGCLIRAFIMITTDYMEHTANGIFKSYRRG